MLSLCMAGELSHWPARDTSMMFCHQELPQTKLDRLSEWVDSDGVRVAAGHFSFTNQVTFTSQQLDHFGCKSNKRLTDMHKSGIMDVVHLAGQTATHRVAPLWRNLAFNWATSAMRIACAAKKQAKDLTADFQSNEILCLAEILTEEQDIKSISLGGSLSYDYTVHVADALAVDRLIKALHKQPQLESLSIVLTGPIFPDPEDVESFEDPCAEERAVSEVTAKLFCPAWESLSGLLEHKAMLSLRQVHVKLPHPEGCAIDHMQQVADSVRIVREQKRAAQATAFAMGTHPRLGADCVLRTVPFQILGKIVRHAKDLEPDSMHISCSERVPIYTMEQLD